MINDFMHRFNIGSSAAMARLLGVDPASVRRWRLNKAPTPEYITKSVWAHRRIREALEETDIEAMRDRLKAPL